MTTTPAKLMSDFACQLKKEMIYLMNEDPDRAAKHCRKTYPYFKDDLTGQMGGPDLFDELKQFSVPTHVAAFINLPPFEGIYSSKISSF